MFNNLTDRLDVRGWLFHTRLQTTYTATQQLRDVESATGCPDCWTHWGRISTSSGFWRVCCIALAQGASHRLPLWFILTQMKPIPRFLYDFYRYNQMPVDILSGLFATYGYECRGCLRLHSPRTWESAEHKQQFDVHLVSMQVYKGLYFTLNCLQNFHLLFDFQIVIDISSKFGQVMIHVKISKMLIFTWIITLHGEKYPVVIQTIHKWCILSLGSPNYDHRFTTCRTLGNGFGPLGHFVVTPNTRQIQKKVHAKRDQQVRSMNSVKERLDGSLNHSFSLVHSFE